MLMITQDKVLPMDCGDRFRYLGHGKFIADCFQDQDRFQRLVELLRADQELDHIHEE